MRTIERRIGLLFAGFLLCFLVIVGRAFWLQGVQGAQLASEASYQQTEVVTVPGLRGTMLDRHGDALAASEDAATIYATPYQVKKPQQTAEKLASILGEKPPTCSSEPDQESASACRQKGRRADRGADRTARTARHRRAARQPPDLSPGGHRLSGDRLRGHRQPEGLSGLGASEERVLHGSSTANATVIKDALGQPIKLDTVRAQPSDGSDIQLTLDPAIQAKTEQVLAEVGETYSPKGATAIVVDPRNSQILAMANWPPVDPNNIAAANPDQLANRRTGFTYEPGSTFKAFTVSAALEEKASGHAGNGFGLAPVSGRRSRHRRRRGAADRDPDRRPDPRPVLERGRGHDRPADWARRNSAKWIHRFGFGKPTGVQYPGEERGIVPRLSDYSGSTMGNLPIGQGLGHPDPDGGRLLGDRRRRHPAPAAACAPDRGQAGPPAPGPTA